jgi:hypothetical protein
VELRRSLEPQGNDALRRELAEVTSAANEGLQRCLWWTCIRQLRAAILCANSSGLATPAYPSPTGDHDPDGHCGADAR